MKVLIWFVCYLVATFLNVLLGYATGFRVGYLIFYFIVAFVAKKLCSKWDEYKVSKEEQEDTPEIQSIENRSITENWGDAEARKDAFSTLSELHEEITRLFRVKMKMVDDLCENDEVDYLLVIGDYEVVYRAASAIRDRMKGIKADGDYTVKKVREDLEKCLELFGAILQAKINRCVRLHNETLGKEYGTLEKVADDTSIDTKIQNFTRAMNALENQICSEQVKMQ